jgi:MFS family permease
VSTAGAIRQPKGAFAALSVRGYRIYLSGQALANTGSWMQSIAQDWLIFTLTHSSTAVGVTMALQFLPMLLFGLHTGAIADRIPKRTILLITQTLNAILTLALAGITIAGLVRPGYVYAFALLAGIVFAFDSPARQAFVSEVVPPSRLRAAVSLTAAVFQATRLVGPAIASLLIATAGTGWVFGLNALCYLGPTVGLLLLRPSDLQPSARKTGARDDDAPPASAPASATDSATGTRGKRGGVLEAARYVRARPDMLWTIFVVGMLGTFGLNFPIVLTAMASAFHGNASTYGLFNIVLAIGSSAGALLAASGARPRQRVIIASAAAFGLLQAAAAVMPGIVAFLPVIAAMGFVNLVFQAMANSSIQLSVDAGMRGRVMGLYMLVFIGGTPIGAPLVGALTSHYGPRAGMAVCGIIPALAALAAAVGLHLRTTRQARARRAAQAARDREEMLALMPAAEIVPGEDEIVGA